MHAKLLRDEREIGKQMNECRKLLRGTQGGNLDIFFPPVASWLSPGRSTPSLGMQHVPLIQAL